MSGWRRSMAVAAVLFALLPAAAAAQSAGDEQYEDPLAGQESEQPAPTATATPAPAPAAPAPDADSAQAPAPTAVPAAPAPSAGAAQLPRTGADPLLAALTGALLLGAGVALRVRLRAG